MWAEWAGAVSSSHLTLPGRLPPFDAAPSPWALEPPTSLQPSPCQPSGPLQEMLAIMKSIYDMMGRHTYPILREDAPLEHVERFFQVSTSASQAHGEGQPEEGGPALRAPLGKPLPSEAASHCKGVQLALPTCLVVRALRAN